MAPAAPDHADMPHAPAGLVADAHPDHLVVPPQGAVEKDERAAGEALPQPSVTTAQPGMKKKLCPLAVSTISSPTASPASLSPGSCTGGFEIERHFARHGKGATASPDTRRAGKMRWRRSSGNSIAPDTIGRQHAKNRVGGDNVEHRPRRVNREPMTLAQVQQAGNRIDIAAGHHDPGNRRRSQPFARVQHRCRLDLQAQIGRGVQDEPIALVGRKPQSTPVCAREHASDARRASRQAGALEFHCGNPPPAAAPRTTAWSIRRPSRDPPAPAGGGLIRPRRRRRR